MYCTGCTHSPKEGEEGKPKKASAWLGLSDQLWPNSMAVNKDKKSKSQTSENTLA